MFSLGDVVELKSGGLPMTIEYITDDGQRAGVAWMDPKTRSLTRDELNLTSLKEWTEEDLSEG